MTFGSSVPLCPVLFTLKMRRIQATTSCEDGVARLVQVDHPIAHMVLQGPPQGGVPCWNWRVVARPARCICAVGACCRILVCWQPFIKECRSLSCQKRCAE